METEADLPPQAHDQSNVDPVVPDEQHPPLPQVVGQPPPVQHQTRPRVRDNKSKRSECIYFMEAMHSIFPIGPTEWDQDLNLHSV